MKSFKKVLALVLSVAMVLGTMTMAFGQTIVPADLFSDVTAEYETAVAKLKAVNVLDGYADGTVRLENTLTRAEVAKTIVALLGLAEGVDVNGPNTTTFADVNGHWAASWISIATGQGIIKGHADGTFKPNDPVTEEQAVAMIVRALEWGPVVAGNYPYGENAKAMELGLVKKSPVYGKEATRGYVFAAAAEALTAPMAERKATQGSVTYEGEGIRTLLETRLGYKAATEVVVDKTARMERELDKNEFQSGKATFVYKNEDFDATEILGEVVNVWYDVNERTKENEVIFVEIDAVDSNKVEGTVTAVDTKKDEITVDERTYSLDKDAIVYRDNKAEMPKVGDYAKLTLDKKNNVVFADAFDLTVADVYQNSQFNLVSEIEKVEDGAKEDFIRFRDQNGDTRTITNEKIVVYKDGKIGNVEDIKDLDLVKELKSDRSKTTLIYAIEASLTGKIDKVVADSKAKKQKDAEITMFLGDEEIVVNQANFVIAGGTVDTKAVDKGSDKDEYNFALANELRNYVKADSKDVTVFVMPNGKAAMMVTEIAAREVKSALVYGLGKEYRTFDAKDYAAINFLTHEGKEEAVTFRDVYTAHTLYSFKAIRPDHRGSGNEDNHDLVGQSSLKYEKGKVTVYTNGKPGVKDNVTLKNENSPQVVNLGTTGNDKVDSVKGYSLKTDNKIYNITNSTVFYNLKDDGTKYEVKKYDDIKDADVKDVYVKVFTKADTNDHKTPVADIVVVTSGTFKTKDKDLAYGIVNRAYKIADAVVYVVDKGDEVVEYALAKDAEMKLAGYAIAFRETNEKVGDLVKIKIEADKSEVGKLTNIRSGQYTIETANGRFIFDTAAKAIIDVPSYDSNKTYNVSYILENDKIKVLAVIGDDAVIPGQTLNGERVVAVDTARNTVTIRLANGDRKTYDVFGNDAKALMPLVDKADEISFEVDSYGDIVKFTGIKLYTDVTLANELIINRHDDFKLFGEGRTITGNIKVASNRVYVQDVEVTGTVTLDSSVNHFEAKNTNFDNLTLNGGGTNSVVLENVNVTTLNVAAKVNVILNGTSKVTTLNANADGATVQVKAKEASVVTLNASKNVKVTGAGTVDKIIGDATVEGVTVKEGDYATAKPGLKKASDIATVTGTVYVYEIEFTMDTEVVAVGNIEEKVTVQNAELVSAAVANATTIKVVVKAEDTSKDFVVTIAEKAVKSSVNTTKEVTNDKITVTYKYNIDRWQKQ